MVCPPTFIATPTALWWCVPGGTGRPLGRLFSKLLLQRRFQVPEILPASLAVIHAAKAPTKGLSQADEHGRLVPHDAAN